MLVYGSTVTSVLYVVPTLGLRPEYLSCALDSLAAQDHPVAVVVVAPADAEDAHRAARERGMDFLTQSGRGLSRAVNDGWDRFGARHAFWAWLGDDDLLASGSARTAATALQRRPSAAMVYGRCGYMDAHGRQLHEVRPTSVAGRLLRWGPNLVPQPGSVARADAVRRVGMMDETLRYAMDLDLFLRLKDVGPLHYVPRLLAWFRWHPESTTVSGSGESEAEAQLVRERTWTGRRAVGRYLEPEARMAGRALHRLQRFPSRGLDSPR